MSMSRCLAVLVLLTGIVACGNDPSVVETQIEKVTDPNSMQAIRDVALQRESMPGKAHYLRACASCHEGQVSKAPHKEMIGLMTPEAILGSLTTGIMQTQASMLSEQAQKEVSEYLAGQVLGTELAEVPACKADVHFDALGDVQVQRWGIDVTNRRDQSNKSLDADSIGSLKALWAVKFPGANRVRSQPAIGGGLLFVGSHNGKVYALDADSGCRVWSFQASGEVRTGMVLDARTQSGETSQLYFGDVLGNVYSLNAHDGELIWRIRADDHPNTTITATPTLAGDRLIIPISSLEVVMAVDPEYACCTFRGSILAVDAATGEQHWRRYTIAEEPAVVGQNDVGTDIIGPSGAVVWNTPAVDIGRGQLYFGTGENMSSPATKTSDAIFALDLETGDVKWTAQTTANDVWNTACDTDTPQNCPPEQGPDFDFGAATLLVSADGVGDLVIGGQKSGIVYAFDPDNGEIVWQQRVGRGGIQGGIHFGMAASGQQLFVPVSDMPDGRTYPDPGQPGMHALDIATGKIIWSTVHDDSCEGRGFCHPGISQVPTVIGDLVIAGAMDGVARAYETETGQIVWSLDTNQRFETVQGEPTTGGSFGGAAGPVAFGERIVLSSGYGLYNHMPGNLLLVLSSE